MSLSLSWSCVGAFVACGLFGVAIAAAQPPAGPPREIPEDVVVTHGEHVSRATPDVAFVTVVAEARTSVPREAQATSAATMNGVQQKLKGAGIPEEAMRTRSMDLRPEFDYANGRQTLRGYVASNSLEVRVDAVDRVGEIIDLAVGAGASRVEELRFDRKKRRELERDVLRRAVEDAMERAKAMAAGTGRALGAIVRVEDDVAPRVPEPRPVMAMRAAADAAESATPIQAGQLEVRARVTVVVRLVR